MPVDYAITLTILHSLWQGALIGFAAVATLRMLRGAPANARYVVAVVALAATAVAGVATFAALRAQSGFGTEGRSITQVASSDGAHAFAASDASSSASQAVGQSGVSDRLALMDQVQQVATGTASLSTENAGATTFVAAMWLVGVLGFGLYFMCGWVMAGIIRSRASRIPAERIALRARDIALRMGVARPIRVYSCSRIDTPAVIGWIRPALLLPVSVVTGLAPGQLDLIIAHEIAHIRRHDYAVNIIQLVVETLFFFNPAVWWLSREIRIERERACDDLVVSCGQRRRDYATALVHLEQLRLAIHRSRRTALPRLALGAADGSLADRIRRLLHDDAVAGADPRRGRRGMSSGRLAAGLMIVVLAVLTISTAPVMAQLWNGLLPQSIHNESGRALSALPPPPPMERVIQPKSVGTQTALSFFRSAGKSQTAIKLEQLILNAPDDATLHSALAEIEKLPASATMPSWLRLLESSDVVIVRSRAVTLLAEMDPRFVVSALEHTAMYDDNANIQMLALSRLDRLPDDRGVPALLNVVHGHRELARRSAALGMLNARGGDVATHALERALYDDPNTQVQLEALRLLASHGPNRWNGLFLEHVRDNHFSSVVRARAAALLNEARADVGVPGARPNYYAAATLRRGQGLSATALKLEQLVFVEESDATRMEALEAIAALSGGAGMTVLNRIAATHSSRDIRARATNLAEATMQRASFHEAMGKAANALRYEQDVTLRLDAVSQLAEWDALSVIGSMHSAIVNDPSRDVQMRALDVLAARDELAAGDALAKVARRHADSMIRLAAIGVLRERLDVHDALDVLSTVLVEERDYGVWTTAAAWASQLPNEAGRALLESAEGNVDLPVVFRRSATARLRGIRS